MTKKQKRDILSIGLTLAAAVVLVLIGREDLLNENWEKKPAEINENRENAPAETEAEISIDEKTEKTEIAIGDKKNELEIVTVKRIVDGDTIELSDGRKVRYIGIDTPETKDPRRPVGCFGAEASEANRLLVEGKNVGLEKDVSETDRYGRLLRYVYLLEDETSDESNAGDQRQAELKMVQEILLTEGYAQVYRYPPDVKYIENFKQLEQAARDNEKGLWSLDNCPASNTTLN